MVLKKDLSTALNARILGSSSSSGKETLVLAHGYGGDQSIWDKILPHLAERYQVLVFDWCFSGAIQHPGLYDAVKYAAYDAFADDLILLVDEMKLESCVFVGHSMSGMIGCIASIKRPDLFKRLILVGASPRFINLDDYEGGFGHSDIEQLLSSIEFNYEQWASTFASLVVDPRDPPSVEKFEKCLKRMGVEVGLPLAKTVFFGDYREILEKVVTPCSIIQTKKDFAVPFAVARYMQSKIKANPDVEIIDTEGHFPQLTAHVQFMEVLDRILSS